MTMPRALHRILALGFAVSVAFLLATESPSYAYPQWQFSSGAVRCNQCHFAPAGGGLLTGYGRDAVGDELSTFGGNGAFLHGAVTLPKGLSLGGDFRGAFVAQDVQDIKGATVAAFPMQADLAARMALPLGFSVTAAGGLRGQVRDPNTLVPIQNYQPVSTSEFISREHYVTWQPEPTGPYVRAGRFYAPFGLRFAEHILYMNRDLGFDETQETYNVSAGWLHNDWELHVSLFAPDVVRHIGSDENGLSILYEYRLADENASVAAQTRIASGPGLTRFIFGGYGKSYVPRARTLFFAELDGVQLLFDDPQLSTRVQAVGTIGATLLARQGTMVTLLGERFQEDVALPTSWTAATALLNWFPYAHGELQLMGRLQLPSGGSLAKTLFIQLHYFL